MPIGTAIAEASATISIVPRIALLTPPMSEFLKNVLPVGSVVKKSAAPGAEPLLEQVVDDQHERHEREHRRRQDRAARQAVASAPARADREPLQQTAPPLRRVRSCSRRRVGRQRGGGGPGAVLLGARRPAERPARTTKHRAMPLTSSVRTNSTSPHANRAERCVPWASPNSFAITAARLLLCPNRFWTICVEPADQDRDGDRLADRAPESEHRAADDPRAAVGEDRDTDHLPARRAERERRLLVVGRDRVHDLPADRADDRQDHDREHEPGDEAVGDRDRAAADERDEREGFGEPLLGGVQLRRQDRRSPTARRRPRARPRAAPPGSSAVPAAAATPARSCTARRRRRRARPISSASAEVISVPTTSGSAP